MAMPYEGASSTYNDWLTLLNGFFVLIFVLECLFKIFAMGLYRYFADSWNRFDFFIAFFSMIDLAFESLIKMIIVFDKSDSILRAIRVLRVVRLLRIAKWFKGVL